MPGTWGKWTAIHRFDPLVPTWCEPRVSQPRRVWSSCGMWALGLCLVIASDIQAEAQEPRSFAEMLLRWPKTEPKTEPETDAESETDTEAEEPEEFIETDRNSFTFAPFTPGDGRLIVESAYSYINIGQEGAKHSFPETVFRYGIGDRLELRLGYNYETGRASRVAEGDIAGNFGINAEQQILYGFKYAVTRAEPRIPPHASQCFPRAGPHAGRLGRGPDPDPARLRLGLGLAQRLDVRPGGPVRDRPRGRR